MVKIFPFLQWTRDINRRTLRGDLIAGITGAIIVLPQGLAFAVIAELPGVRALRGNRADGRRGATG